MSLNESYEVRRSISEEQNIENLRELVQVSPCGKSSCKLRRGTNSTVTLRFKPSHKVKNLITMVHANIAGVPLPFIGVDGVSACDHIVNADTKEAVSCPLQPDVEYLYSNTFPVESYYPVIDNLVVHWALNDGKKDLICFEVPAGIKN